MLTVKRNKRARKTHSKRKNRLASVDAEMKAREEFWSDPCWQEPLTKRSIT